MGTRLRFIRELNKFERDDLAKALNDVVSASAVRNWETGEATPTLLNLHGLSKLYGVSVEYLTCAEFSDMSDEQLARLTVARVARRPMTAAIEYDLSNRTMEARDG